MTLDRREFLHVATLTAAVSLLPRTARADTPPPLRAQRLAWAGVKLQLDTSTLFLDPLINPNVWEGALKDPLIDPEPGAGDRFVLVTHRHPDHFDPSAVRKALGNGGTIVFALEVSPAGAAAGFKVRVAQHYEPQ